VARSAGSSAAIIAPLLAVADPRIRRTPRHWTGIDRHYHALGVEMMAPCADLGIACGQSTGNDNILPPGILERLAKSWDYPAQIWQRAGRDLQSEPQHGPAGTGHAEGDGPDRHRARLRDVRAIP